MEKQTHTTPCGYTYKYIPHDIQLTRELKQDLDEAVKYRNFTSFRLSQREVNHFVRVFGMEESIDPGNVSLIYKHQELYMTLLKGNHKLYTAGLFDPLEDTLLKEFALEIGIPETRGFRRGLEKILDYNYGGNMYKEHLEHVRLLMWG